MGVRLTVANGIGCTASRSFAASIAARGHPVLFREPDDGVA
jgi:hypothetical protein